jgi:hypothetical protein
MEEINGIQISRNTCLNTLPFADDQVIVSNSENELQTSAHKLNKLTYEYEMTVSTEKIKNSDILWLRTQKK